MFRIEINNQILISALFEKLTLIVDPIVKPYTEQAFDIKIVSGAFAKKKINLSHHQSLILQQMFE